MHDIEEIKLKIIELKNNNPSFVSVGYGYKKIGGNVTDELCIIISIKQKKPLSELSSDEIIPTEIQLSTGKIKTDVEILHSVVAIACNAYCGTYMGPNSDANRQVVRPLKGGISITSTNNVSTVGTMGFIAVHSATGAFVGVTNNHVLIQDAFYTSERNLAGPIKNEYSPADYVYQNGESGVVPPANYTIGQSLRYVPIHQWDGVNYNYVDGAIFSIKQTDSNSNALIDITQSYKQIGETVWTLPYQFATTAEIDNLMVTNPMIYSSGRSTGPKGGPTCPMRILEINTYSTTDYHRQGNFISCYFAGLIKFVKPANDPDTSTVCSNPIMGGDSGSALIADFGGTKKIIGLVYAAGYDPTGSAVIYGYACRIDKVATELGIEAWSGGSRNYINPATIEYKTTPNGSSNKILHCNGKDYWQVGLTTLSNPC